MRSILGSEDKPGCVRGLVNTALYATASAIQVVAHTVEISML
jgi:hypothetical protein